MGEKIVTGGWVDTGIFRRWEGPVPQIGHPAFELYQESLAERARTNSSLEWLREIHTVCARALQDAEAIYVWQSPDAVPEGRVCFPLKAAAGPYCVALRDGVSEVSRDTYHALVTADVALSAVACGEWEMAMARALELGMTLSRRAMRGVEPKVAAKRRSEEILTTYNRQKRADADANRADNKSKASAAIAAAESNHPGAPRGKIMKAAAEALGIPVKRLYAWKNAQSRPPK